MTTRVDTSTTVRRGRFQSVALISMKFLSRKEPNMVNDSSKESLHLQIPLNTSVKKEDGDSDDTYSAHSKNSANNSAPNVTLKDKPSTISNSKVTSDHSMVCLVETYSK